MPDAKNSSKVTIHLTESEFKRLIKYKGLAFKIQNKKSRLVYSRDFALQNYSSSSSIWPMR